MISLKQALYLSLVAELRDVPGQMWPGNNFPLYWQGSFDLANLNLQHIVIQNGACACWRWATSGLAADVINDPASAFTFIAIGADPDPNSLWRTNQAYSDMIDERRTEYQMFVAASYNAVQGVTWNQWYEHTLDSVMQASILIGGMQLGQGPDANGVRYYVAMHHSPQDPDGTRNPPNYNHWWVRINLGVGKDWYLETWPGSTFINFKYNSPYAVANVREIEVTGLAAAHMAVLNGLLP